MRWRASFSGADVIIYGPAEGGGSRLGSESSSGGLLSSGVMGGDGLLISSGKG